MSRTSSYNQKCTNPKCSFVINYDNEQCWYDSDDPKGFCSVKCKEEFINNDEDNKRLKQLKQRIYSNTNRKNEQEKKEREREREKQEELADFIYLWLKPNMPKSEVIKMIVLGGLKAENL